MDGKLGVAFALNDVWTAEIGLASTHVDRTEHAAIIGADGVGIVSRLDGARDVALHEQPLAVVERRQPAMAATQHGDRRRHIEQRADEILERPGQLDQEVRLVLVGELTRRRTRRHQPCMKPGIDTLQPRGKGAIVNNASVLAWRAQEGQAHYAAAKAGVMALTRCAAIEAAPFGVRINAVAPSIAMHAFLAKVTTDEVLDVLTSREAFGRAAEPWEIANVIVFLASDYSTYMTGEVVSVSSQHP